MLKFKYFFNCNPSTHGYGTPEGEDMDNWLKDHQDITIINTAMSGGGLSVFYEEYEITTKDIERIKECIKALKI